MAPWLENTLLALVDTYFGLLPQRRPMLSQLNTVKLVSHRGERDKQNVFENTFAAFDPIVEAGIWGIECDIRWTKDLVPVVIHDENALRVFNKDFVIAEHTWLECQQALPLVPSLEALLQRYGKRCHLMLELKQERYPDPKKQSAILEQLLGTLEPSQDFHVISLECSMFAYLEFLPKQALLPVSTTNAKVLSDYAIDKQLGGVTGHFLFINHGIITKHHALQQAVGSGFANSRNVLFREINKGTDWVFSNHALAMHQIIQDEIEHQQA